jgi:hypothetical protein
VNRWIIAIALILMASFVALCFGQTEIRQPFPQPEQYNQSAINRTFRDLYDLLARWANISIVCEASRTIEHVVLFPARSQQSQTLGSGFPDVEQYDTGTNKPKVTSLDFDASSVEVMEFNWHPLHNIDRQGDWLYVDIHYSMATAHTGTVRMKLEMWRANAGTDLSALGAANASVAWTINPDDNDRVYDYNFYEIPYSGTIRGGEFCKIAISSLAPTSRQCEYLCRLSREATDGTYDTHTGSLSVYRVEFHYKVSNTLESYGE